MFGEQLATHLARKGWKLDFAALQSVDTGRVVGASTLADRGRIGRLDLDVVRSLRRRIKRTSPSVILANGGATLRYAVAARTLLRPHPVLAYASIGEPRYWIRSKRHERLQSFLHRRADVVLAVSSVTKQQLINDLGVDAHRVHVAHTGVGSRYFVPSDEPHDELRLVYVGSLSPEKDPLAALQVVHGLSSRHDVKVRFVGDGPLAVEAQHRTRELGLDDAVTFTGSVENVIPHLKWADLLILTSRTEGLPGAALEASAASTPVVAFDVGGTAETMVSGETGVLVQPSDTEAMVAAIDQLARDRNRLEKMGRAASSFVAEQFPLDAAIDRYDAVLTEATRASAL